MHQVCKYTMYSLVVYALCCSLEVLPSDDQSTSLAPSFSMSRSSANQAPQFSINGHASFDNSLELACADDANLYTQNQGKEKTLIAGELEESSSDKIVIGSAPAAAASLVNSESILSEALKEFTDQGSDDSAKDSSNEILIKSVPKQDSELRTPLFVNTTARTSPADESGSAAAAAASSAAMAEEIEKALAAPDSAAAKASEILLPMSKEIEKELSAIKTNTMIVGGVVIAAVAVYFIDKLFLSKK